jgi:hypothetical protein
VHPNCFALAVFSSLFLGESNTVCLFQACGNGAVSLLGGLLNVLPVENEVIPVDVTSLED